MIVDMTNYELNLSIARLAKRVQKLDRLNTTSEQEEEIKAELRRLYRVDDTFTSLSKNSVLRLLRLNLRFREIPLHNFGLMIPDNL